MEVWQVGLDGRRRDRNPDLIVALHESAVAALLQGFASPRVPCALARSQPATLLGPVRAQIQKKTDHWSDLPLTILLMEVSYTCQLNRRRLA